MVIEAKWVGRLGVGAVTVWPFVFMDPRVWSREAVIRHENVHLRQQRRWAIRGVGLGLLVWYVLYLFALPVGWNPWRERWEREAYRAQGVVEDRIRDKLCRWPYCLWWQSGA